VELELIQKIGERELGGGRREPLYAFRREEKRDIGPSFSIIAFGTSGPSDERQRRHCLYGHSCRPRSPGQIFKLPEWDIRERVESIEQSSGGGAYYHESSSEPQIRRHGVVEHTWRRSLGNDL